MTTAPAGPAIEPLDVIAAGDAAASAGDWVTAVDRWESALVGEQSERATERLRWFLEQEAAAPTKPTYPRKAALLYGVGCAALGTGVVFLAQSADGTLATLLSIVIWLLYGAAAVAAIVYARWSGPVSNEPPSPIDLGAARSAASALSENHAPHAGNVAR